MVRHDSLNNLDLSEAAAAGFKVIDIIQRSPSHVQVAALGLLFALVTKHHRVDGPEAMRVVANMIGSAERRDDNAHYRALKLYVENELK